jgi:glycosyltransferase involved in cell wall biosynthesis
VKVGRYKVIDLTKSSTSENLYTDFAKPCIIIAVYDGEKYGLAHFFGPHIEVAPEEVNKFLSFFDAKNSQVDIISGDYENLNEFKNMIESKGSMDVLKVCNKLKKEGTNFECNFVGKFQDKEFKKKFNEQLSNYELKEECKYLGAKYDKDKKKIFERTKYFIFPTKYPKECYPLVILESFMYGIPVLSYNNGAIKEIISKDYLGIVSNNDWESLANYITISKNIEYQNIRNYFKKFYIFKNASNKMKEILLK